MENKNTGLAYELLTQQVYQQILDYEYGEYQKIDVKHDVQIIGKTKTTYQVDVYWEFKVAGILYKTVIEVKDWKRKVEQEHIMAFRAKLDDIPGGPRGIFISRSGFQSGAINFAKGKDIKLYILDQTNTMNHVIMNFHYRFPHVEHFIVIPDREWLFAQAKSHAPSEKLRLSYRVPEAMLCDDNGNQRPLIDFIKEVQKQHIHDEIGKVSHIAYKFEDPWYLCTQSKKLPKVRLRGLEFDFYITESQEIREMHPDWVADYILHDIIEGTKTGFNTVHGLINLD